MKIFKHIGHLKQKVSGFLMGSSNRNVSVPGKALGDVFTREDAIQALLERGKSIEHSELIVKTMEDWEMDYSLSASMDFKVTGDSVWIDTEK